MKKYFLFGLGAMLLVGLSLISYSQDGSGDDLETYVKTNIAVSKFKILGVTQKQFAKCLETENYSEPDKKLRLVVIDKATFADDGKGYDLVAGDGILTSNELYFYKGVSYTPGTYHNSPDHEAVVADEIFGFHNRVNTGEKWKISCKFRWVPCREMSYPQSMLCEVMGWPYGGFRLTECEITWEARS